MSAEHVPHGMVVSAVTRRTILSYQLALNRSSLLISGAGHIVYSNMHIRFAAGITNPAAGLVMIPRETAVIQVFTFANVVNVVPV